MPKIQKIKREQLTDLGDEFIVLNDDEIKDSGITLEPDEVLIMDAPVHSDDAEVGDDGGENEVANMRKRLRSVNRESAQRRISLREAELRNKALEAQLADAQKTLLEQVQEKRKSTANGMFTNYVKEKNLVFVSPEAESDVREAAFSTIDWSKEVSKESLAPLIDQAVDRKKYVLKTVNLPRTEGGAQGNAGEGTVEIDLDEVSTAFGLPNYIEKE